MIADKACWERGCACHDSRIDGSSVELVEKKEWVGLAAQEAADCWATSATKTWQAIEAKLKEKNFD